MVAVEDVSLLVEVDRRQHAALRDIVQERRILLRIHWRGVGAWLDLDA